MIYLSSANRSLQSSPKSGNTEETVKMAKKTSEELFTEINELNIEELEILAAALRKNLGIHPANAPADQDYAYPVPGYEIILTECIPHNVQVIKLISRLTYRSLSDSKACLDHLPITIADYRRDDEAFAIRKMFEDAGAVVKLERVWG